MADKRSVHGGKGSHLCIEVSAVRFTEEADGSRHASTCNSEPWKADAFAVYIRNPLAFHVEDFELPGGARPSDPEQAAAERQAARGKAFAYADALADHLGCEVVSFLPRVGETAPNLPPRLPPVPVITVLNHVDEREAFWTVINQSGESLTVGAGLTEAAAFADFERKCGAPATVAYRDNVNIDSSEAAASEGE
jgi:hypothetical protein